MAKVPLNAPWRPDHPAMGNPGLLLVRNCLPGAGHYRPLNAPEPINSNTFSGPAEGLWVGAQPNGTLLQFAAFDGHVYRLPGHALTPVLLDGASYPYGYDVFEGERWRAIQYGPLAVITNYNDPIQAIDITDLNEVLDDLDASAPQARYIAVIRDFIVVGDTVDNVDGAVSSRVRWHGIDATTGLPDPTEWAINLSTRADFQDIADLGTMKGLTGGLFGTVLFERGIARMDFGGTYVFSVSVPVTQIGCFAEGSVVQLAQQTYFFGENGIIYRFDGQSAIPINRFKNDAFLRSDIELGELHTMWAVADPGRRLLYWSYGATGGSRRLLCYSVDADEFTLSGVDTDALGQSVSFARDLDVEVDFPDLDAMDIDLDDPRLWVGGQMQVGAVKSGQIKAFIGVPLTGSFQTGDLELTEGRRSVMNRAMVQHEGGSIQLRVGIKERPNGDIAWGDYMTAPQSDGFWRFRSCGRYHRPDLLISGEWRKLHTLEFWGAGLGER